MKKIGLLLLLLILSGCNNSSVLTNTCIKEEKANTLTSTTTYTITFQKDIISSVKVEERYDDTNFQNIEAIILAKESQHAYWKKKSGLSISTNRSEMQYVITYDMNYSLLEEEMKQQFRLLESRTKMVNQLKENGFSCK